MILTDRSSYVAHLACRRKGWLYKYSGTAGHGLAAAGRPLYFPVGQAVHTGVQALASGANWQTVEETLNGFWRQQLADSTDSKLVVDPSELREQQDLSIALPLVWEKERLNAFQREYRVLAIEQEIQVQLADDVLLRSRPDMIIQHLQTGLVYQWELKTKATINDSYLRSWEHNLQLVVQSLAIEKWMVEQGIGDPYGGAIVEVLIKGQRKRDKAGVKKQQSNLIYAYARGGDGFAIAPQLSHSWKRDWRQELVSAYKPLREWIFHDLPTEETAPKALVIPTITPSAWWTASAVRQWVKQVQHQFVGALFVKAAELDGPEAVQEALDIEFPMTTEHCDQYDGCEFIKACWDTAVSSDPEGSGVYVAREDNHATMTGNE